MHRHATLLLLVPTLFASVSFAEDHSTVNVVFVVPSDQATTLNAGGERSTVAMVGNVVLPLDSIRPISISIDDEFVGHALVGAYNVKPVFVLPSGTHEFSFTCEGFVSTSAGLEVLGNGSQQYLIVRMIPERSHTGPPEQSQEPATDAASGIK